MSKATPLRIAMWSGPRNISTALMRSFENRPDCVVSDEPLYGAWLAATGEPHPMAAKIIAEMECDYGRLFDTLTGPVPGNRPLWYQKHMCHHLLDDTPLDWLGALCNVFLIRHPRRVVASYLKMRDRISPEAIGLPQQWRLFRFCREQTGTTPLVVDSDRFLEQPEAQLRQLCERLGIPFTEAMLSWPAGPRDSDGIWAPHWYRAVWKSTGFAPPRGSVDSLPEAGEAVVDSCLPIYQKLRVHAIDIQSSSGPLNARDEG